jgi:hypothetical protein
MTASGTLGAVKVLTDGAANLDFTLASGSTWQLYSMHDLGNDLLNTASFIAALAAT